jgi:hypothetical protein
MKAISTLALVAAGAVFINSTPLRASEAANRIDSSFNKSPAYQPHIRYDAVKIEDEASAQLDERVDERVGFRFQDGVGDLLAPRVKPETGGAQPMTNRAPMIELRVATPNNVFQSEKHPSIEYSGILVQALRNNPLQLFNLFAPAQYGDGEANTFRDLITGRPEGLKLLSIRF